MEVVKRPMLVQFPIHIKAYEIDVMGIVSNIVYVKWFEDLRHAFMEQYYPYSEMIAQKKSPLLMKTEVHYRLPLTIHDCPVGQLWVAKLGKTKWEMEFEIISGNTIHCSGRQVGCFFDIEKNCPTEFPDSLLKKYRDEISQS